MNKLSVVIITKNSAKFIEGAVKSALFADEVLILDSGSSDNTCETAKAMGARVEFQEWLGFGKQKQKAVDLAKNDWVFVLDSDERITAELQNEIKAILENPEFNAYYVPRINVFWGREIKRLGLYPDYSVRLFDKKKAKFNEKEVHESVECECEIGYLKSPMKHLAYESIEEFIDKQNRYSTLGAKPNKLKAFISPLWTFFKLYFIKLGFLEGWDGFVIARLYSQYTFWKYVKGKK
ncbi:lipopolysaccharide core biosynthesis glycosyl transferase WaaE [Nautilia profundicola AmH]|uniref:Lipopolysaccharide core biosynthesis glycosyl transferase WaaE n=1 Tax=Nautilia profundicola (strain ATCC BAA-1463 / DSM 18972 / AmH) TaxID=598659 RepID=B9L6W4_NAUPA|nr:glycosyltransferase family 2 protein [Nautilia profundicola]ACM92096.1 lipopolysaccharide core biosynthesis glycosyl transferase WaaE [Nautilia profundicola AmH]